MDARSEDSVRAEISAIEAIPYAQRSADDKKRLNDLEAEIRRRHPELQLGKVPSLCFPTFSNAVVSICCIL